ncbi:MAG: Hpt domain-containing protein [Gammaproteobacteria bacterium]|nr:Hpt domain-containing protein [Gammaproteobacteria bacterium]
MSIAQQELDYTTLKWVKDEIQESLNQTRQALEAYVENPNDTTQIRFCATYLHQIYGTLQMVEIYGGALLAEEMELLANAISQGKVSRREDAYEVLMRAILQLPAYLEHLENGQQDMPVILLPLLNDLRTARGEHLLSENAFFSPNLSVALPDDAKKPGKSVDVQQYSKKLRPVYQAALVRWYRNINTAEALKKMAIVIRELLHNSTTENAMRLWWVASGIVEGLLDGGLETSNSIKQLMGHQIDRQIKRITDQGEKSFNENPPVELLKNLLYYVATSTSRGARTGQIKTAFNLEQLLPGSVDVNEAFAQLRGSKTDLMQSVSAVIKEDLLQVKDQLDIFVRTKDRPVSELEPLCGHLHRISDTLAMLGLGDLHKIIQDQHRSIREIVQSGAQPSEFSLMEVASALLYVESSLEGLQSTVTSSVLGSHEKADTLLPPSEQRQLNNLVITEANKLVAEVKEAFNAYAVDTANRSAIESTPGKLDEIRGVLAILELPRAANLLNAAIDYIRHQLLRDDIEPNQKALDLLADVITSIEYFLEAVAENRGHPENILRVAEASAQELGYTPETISEIQINRAATRAEPADEVEIAAVAFDAKPAPAPKAPETTIEKPAAPKPAQAAAAPAVALASKLPEDDIDEEILEIFLEEADEVIGTMQENLRAWKQNQSDSEALTVLRRSYHTIKGSGRLAGAKVVGEFAWSIENMLNRIIDGRLELQPEIFNLLEKAESTLRGCIQHLKGKLDTQPNVQPVVSLADAFANGSYTSAAQPKPDLIDELLSDIMAPAPSAEKHTLELQAQLEAEDETDGIVSPTLELTLEETPAAAVAPEDAAASQNLALLDIFMKETASHLEAVYKYLNKYSDSNVHLVTEPLMRALHTLHGSANMAAVENIAELSEPLDRYFATLYDTRQPVSSDAIDVLTQGAAFIKTMLHGIDDTSIATPDTTDLVQRIHELHEEAKEAGALREEDMLSIVPALDRDENDGLEHVSKMFSNWSPDGLGDMVEVREATSDGLDDTIELAAESFDGLSDTVELVLDEPEAITERIELASNEAFGGLSSSIEVEEIELSAEPESEAITLADEEEVDEELISIFLDEAEELLRNTEALIQGWSSDPSEHSIMDELQRALHTLKGGARMANLIPIANLSHRIETLLEAITDGTVTSSAAVPRAVQRCQDWLSHAVESVRAGKSLEDATELLDLIQSYIDAQPVDERIEAGETSTLEAEEQALEDALPLEEELTLSFAPVLPAAAPVMEAARETQDDDLIAIFLEEAADIQENIEQVIQQWLTDRGNLELVAELQRALHTLKGGARMAHVNTVADVAHAMETLLEQLTEQQLAVTNELPLLIQRSHDWISSAVAKIRDRGQLPEASELLSAIHRYISDSAVTESITLAESPVSEAVTENTIAFEIEERMEPTEAAGKPDVVPAPESGAMEYDEDLVEIFLEEAEEIQENIDRILHDWSKDAANRELIAEVQRALHTLKGGARMAGIKPVGDLSHAIESLMESVTEGRLNPTNEFPRVVHACHDWLAAAIEQVKHHQPLGSPSSLIKQLENLLAGRSALEGISDIEQRAIKTARKPAPAAEIKKPAPKPKAEKKKPEPAPARIEPAAPGSLISLSGFRSKDDYDATLIQRPEETAQSKVRATEEQFRVKSELIDHMVNHAGEVNIYNARIAQQLGQWHFNLKELQQTVGRLREQLRNFEMETEAQIMYRHIPDASAVGAGGSVSITTTDLSFDPLEMDRFSYMQQLSRSMVESFDDLTSIQNALEGLSGDTDLLLLQQSRINNDLQEALMKTRLTPFSSVVARLRRVVRQTCQETGKEADLQIHGAEGEMDRSQLNRIVPALEHILRNAIDHGLEKPADRKKAQKPEIGVIAINFSREGSEVVLRISDDGAGMNVDAIRRKAIERGLIDKNSKVDDDEILDFILQSGFSTAEQVTQISGRGVGMDVVNTEIKQLNGSLYIATEKGKGSTFTIRLPLTVLINQALMVQVDEAVYAISLSNIEHVVRVTSEELNKLVFGKASDYVYAGYQYEHLHIGYVLHGTAPAKMPEKGKFPILLARSGEHRVALQVDQLIGRQEIVIKSVGQQLSSINSISGATILPDGEVALILDLSTLIRTSHALQKTDEVREVAAAVPAEKPPVVLIVDDSITVRKVTQRLLNRHNYEPLTAKDGMDALTVMLENIPDIILLDVEMPRMDGYELATAVRSDPRLKHIPIIMITSRTGDKHRDRALNIGVNMYMGKPYQEHELLENIQSLLNDQ